MVGPRGAPVVRRAEVTAISSVRHAADGLDVNGTDRLAGEHMAVARVLAVGRSTQDEREEDRASARHQKGVASETMRELCTIRRGSPARR